MVKRTVATDISNSLDIGDWWLLYMLGRNLDPMIYKDVLNELVNQIEVKKKARR